MKVEWQRHVLSFALSLLLGLTQHRRNGEEEQGKILSWFFASDW
jgi:hypothetical protein